MSQVTAEMVKKLRDRTGVGMGKCKKALEEAGGDIENAIDLLRKAGMASAVKKESRETNEGTIAFAQNGEAIAIVEINAETDFVVQNDKFKLFAKTICEAALKACPSSIEELSALEVEGGHTIEAYRAEHIQSLGENLKLSRLLIVPKHENRSYGLYSHMKGMILALVEVDGASDQEALARDIAMHATAEDPEYLRPEDVPQEALDREMAIAKEQMKGKPDNVIDKILEGKKRAFYDQICLTKQKFVKDSSVSVEKHVENVGKEAGKTLSVSRYVRWQVGEA